MQERSLEQFVHPGPLSPHRRRAPAPRCRPARPHPVCPAASVKSVVPLPRLRSHNQQHSSPPFSSRPRHARLPSRRPPRRALPHQLLLPALLPRRHRRRRGSVRQPQWLRSTAAAFDWYPFRSVWRFSAGALFLNGNQIAGTTRIASGTSFKLNGQTFYSADPTKVPGAAPITGSGLLGIHTHNPALTLSGGFGRFIPRSERHWSFPSEFGVAFTGPPTVNLNMDGWACLDQKETQCGNVSDASNPVAIQFNNAVQTRLTKLRQSLNSIQIYPLFSYSAVYSFDIRTPRAPR